mgnify:CR=1 FL=1
MAKNTQTWGRETARKRYADGGGVNDSTGGPSRLGQPRQRSIETPGPGREYYQQKLDNKIKEINDRRGAQNNESEMKDQHRSISVSKERRPSQNFMNQSRPWMPRQFED